MIEICPAILTSDMFVFQRQIEEYSKLFSTVDIDINIFGDLFIGEATVNPEDVIDCIKTSTHNFDVHLMVTDPKPIIDRFIECNLTSNLLFFVHQESNINELENEKYKDIRMGLAIKCESELKDIEYYNKFENIQVMTIVTGEQGGEFKKEGLNKVQSIRDMGYTGNIKIDGSVNTETAEDIKNYRIDRVSVGSYFAKASDLPTAKLQLEKALGNVT